MGIIVRGVVETNTPSTIILVFHKLTVLLLVCSTPDSLLSLNFVPRQLFLGSNEGAHSAINSYRTQYENYRTRGAFDTPTSYCRPSL